MASVQAPLDTLLKGMVAHGTLSVPVSNRSFIFFPSGKIVSIFYPVVFRWTSLSRLLIFTRGKSIHKISYASSHKIPQLPQILQIPKNLTNPNKYQQISTHTTNPANPTNTTKPNQFQQILINLSNPNKS